MANPLQYSWASLVTQTIKNHLHCGRSESDPWVEKIPWRRVWQPTPVLLPRVFSWTEKPGRLQSMESQRIRRNWATKPRITRERQKERETETERKESVGNPRVLSYLSIPPTPTSLLPSYMNGACGHSFFFFFNWNILSLQCCVSFKYTQWFIYIYICGEDNGTQLQYSCLENPMEGGAWWAAVHGVAEGRTRLSDFTFTFHFHALEKKMATHSSVLSWRIPGTGEPGGLPSMGSHRVRHDWSDLAAAAYFQIIFHCWLLQDIEHSSLCYTAVPGCLFCIEHCVPVKSGHSFWSHCDFLPRQLQWLRQWFQSMCQMPKHLVALQLFLNHLKHCLNHLLAGKQLRC